MGLIGAPIALFDVSSCEAFVQKAIDRSGIEYSRQEREELLSEGLAIFYELAERYKPLPEPPCGYRAWFAMTLSDRQTYERRLRACSTVKMGSFSGHAAMFLPRRLGDAWHKWHPEHRYVTDPATGKRGWTYSQPVLSLDGVMANHLEQSGDRDRVLLNARTISAFCHASAKLGLSRVASPSIA